jgi:hypothetical protein
MDAKEPAQSSKRLDEGKVAATVGGVGVAASGIYFFRRSSGPESSATTDKAVNPLLAAIAPKPKPENATGVHLFFFLVMAHARTRARTKNEHGQSLTQQIQRSRR